MSCRLTILGSGSSGNCSYLETDTTRLLIDAGLSGKQIEERLASIGKSADHLHAILVTHEHSDHIQGLKVLSSKYRIPIYANSSTRTAILEGAWDSYSGKGNIANWRLFKAGQHFVAGDFDIEPFSIPHDASDPVGFLIHYRDRRIVFLTDLGYVTQLALEKARQADTLILETNHDEKLLQNDLHRPWSVKQRISSRHGHLSNDSAATALAEIMSDRLHHVYLSHLSQESNRPELADGPIEKKLKEIGALHVRITLTSQ